MTDLGRRASAALIGDLRRSPTIDPVLLSRAFHGRAWRHLAPSWDAYVARLHLPPPTDPMRTAQALTRAGLTAAASAPVLRCSRQHAHTLLARDPAREEIPHVPGGGDPP